MPEYDTIEPFPLGDLVSPVGLVEHTAKPPAESDIKTSGEATAPLPVLPVQQSYAQPLYTLDSGGSQDPGGPRQSATHGKPSGTRQYPSATQPQIPETEPSESPDVFGQAWWYQGTHQGAQWQPAAYSAPAVEKQSNLPLVVGVILALSLAIGGIVYFMLL